MTEAGYRRLPPAESSKRLQSCKVVGRIGYINSDPAMPFMLPFGSWRANELAENIMRACIDYGISLTWDAARALAVSIAEKIVKESLNGEFSNLD